MSDLDACYLHHTISSQSLLAFYQRGQSLSLPPSYPGKPGWIHASTALLSPGESSNNQGLKTEYPEKKEASNTWIVIWIQICRSSCATKRWDRQLLFLVCADAGSNWCQATSLLMCIVQTTVEFLLLFQAVLSECSSSYIHQRCLTKGPYVFSSCPATLVFLKCPPTSNSKLKVTNIN